MADSHWTPDRIQRLIADHDGVSYNTDYLSEKLRKSGWSVHQPVRVRKGLSQTEATGTTTRSTNTARRPQPPRKGAKIWQSANSKAERHARDENLRRIRKVRRKQWKRESNYHRRSLAETQVFRFKTIFGDRLQTRQIDNQLKELMLKSAILNRDDTARNAR